MSIPNETITLTAAKVRALVDAANEAQANLDRFTYPITRDMLARSIAAVVAELNAQPNPDKARILTCVYCGHEYPQDTPAHGVSVLTEHIKVCEKHPIRTVQIERDRLRTALAGLVGATTKTELEQMEAAIRLMPAPDQDKMQILNAIHALLSTP